MVMTALAKLRKWADEGRGTIGFIPDTTEPVCQWRIEVQSGGQVHFMFKTAWLASVEEAAAHIVDRLTQIGEITD